MREVQQHSTAQHSTAQHSTAQKKKIDSDVNELLNLLDQQIAHPSLGKEIDLTYDYLYGYSGAQEKYDEAAMERVRVFLESIGLNPIKETYESMFEGYNSWRLKEPKGGWASIRPKLREFMNPSSPLAAAQPKIPPFQAAAAVESPSTQKPEKSKATPPSLHDRYETQCIQADVYALLTLLNREITNLAYSHARRISLGYYETRLDINSPFSQNIPLFHKDAVDQACALLTSIGLQSTIELDRHNDPFKKYQQLELREPKEGWKSVQEKLVNILGDKKKLVHLKEDTAVQKAGEAQRIRTDAHALLKLLDTHIENMMAHKESQKGRPIYLEHFRGYVFDPRSDDRIVIARHEEAIKQVSEWLSQIGLTPEITRPNACKAWRLEEPAEGWANVREKLKALRARLFEPAVAGPLEAGGQQEEEKEARDFLPQPPAYCQEEEAEGPLPVYKREKSAQSKDAPPPYYRAAALNRPFVQAVHNEEEQGEQPPPYHPLNDEAAGQALAQPDHDAQAQGQLPLPQSPSRAPQTLFAVAAVAAAVTTTVTLAALGII